VFELIFLIYSYLCKTVQLSHWARGPRTGISSTQDLYDD